MEKDIPVNGAVLLGGARDDVVAEQKRVADEAKRVLATARPGRRVAVVIAYGFHANPSTGELISVSATAEFTKVFPGALILSDNHLIVGGDRGSAIRLRVFFFQ